MVANESAAETSAVEAALEGQAATGTPRTAAAAAEDDPPGKQRGAREAARSRTRSTTGPQAAGDQTAGQPEYPGTAQDDRTGANKVAARKSMTDKPTEPAGAVPSARTAAAPDALVVRAGEDPWTQEEVDEARDELMSEAERLRNEVVATEEALSGLMRDSGDGAGDDQADAGTKNVTREHEMALAGNAREMLYQTERALDRLGAGTYGRCESCGNAIGKARMQAFPRATLCVDCKQREERRG